MAVVETSVSAFAAARWSATGVTNAVTPRTTPSDRHPRDGSGGVPRVQRYTLDGPRRTLGALHPMSDTLPAMPRRRHWCLLRRDPVPVLLSHQRGDGGEVSERIHPAPKMWRSVPGGSASGEYRIQARKRGGVRLFFREAVIFDSPTAKLAKLFAMRHAAGEIQSVIPRVCP